MSTATQFNSISNTHNESINYARIFAVLPDVVGFPMIRKGKRWRAGRYMSGEISARPDKLVAWIHEGGNGIMLCEAGGECISLFSWMMRFGGCRDKQEAFLKLLACDRSNIVIPQERYRPEVPLRYVYESIVEYTITHRIKKADNLSRYLYGLFGKERSESVLNIYRIGSETCRVPIMVNNEVKNSDEEVTIFWYIDKDGKTLHDKRILYEQNGHRSHSYTGHRKFRIDDGFRGKCLYGSNLLEDRMFNERIFVTESEKTAVICKAYYGKGVFLAAGGNNYLRHEDVREDFTLLADRDAHEMWSKKFTQCQVPRWWEAYEAMGWVCGDKSDIGDAIEWLINNKKENNAART